MLAENLKMLRKAKGYSQEELASKIHVVRQTVSKWEKGLSVPDAELLTRTAEVLEVPVVRLLGSTEALPEKQQDVPPGTEAIAEQLSRINEQLVIRNRRAGRVWRIIGYILLSVLIFIAVTVMALMLLRTHPVGRRKEPETSKSVCLTLPDSGITPF